MSVYNPYNWLDGSSGKTPISAERLNAIEQGIAAAARSTVIPWVAHLVSDQDYTVTPDVSLVYFGGITAPRNVTLPTVAAYGVFRELLILNNTASSQPITIIGQINGTANKTMTGAFVGARLITVGNLWRAFPLNPM